MGALLCVAFELAGCAKAQEFQDWISPPTPAEMSARLQDQASKGHAPEALAAAEAYLVQHPAGAGELHGSMAKLYLEQGNARSAAQHLMLASDAATHRSMPRAEPGGEPGLKAPPDALPQGLSVSAGEGASARILPDGSLSVRAGGASAGVGAPTR